MNKSICIVPHHPGLGGPASFQSRLIRVLKERGYRITSNPLDPSNYAILVVGGTKKIGELRRAQKMGVRVIQRLNGMNWVHRKRKTGLKHYFRSEVNNFILETIRKRADGIIYQSAFSQEWWERVYSKGNAKTTIVFNGVDLQEYLPSGAGGKPTDFYRILMVEGNLGSGYEQGLSTGVELTRLLNHRLDKPVELMVVGNVPADLKASLSTTDINIQWCGVVRREEIPEIDRSAHLLFSADINAACPNSVIEAMACGLPIVGYDTGALKELVVNGSGEIAAYGGDVWNLDKPDIHSLADAAQKIINDPSGYSKNARENAVLNFNIQELTDKYLEMLLG